MSANATANVTAKTISAAAPAPRDAASFSPSFPPNSAQDGAQNRARKGDRSPLAQLLHALNQPLTGLQCSMEVALASPRTVEHYARTLRDGLLLTERMRALVEAIREVTDLEAESNQPAEALAVNVLLQEAVDDLAPVAETKDVRIILDCSSLDCSTLECPAVSSLEIEAARSSVAVAIFRLLESALGLTAAGGDLRIQANGGEAEVCLHLQWRVTGAAGAFSPSEAGLWVAQAGWERLGARWERERVDSLESVSIRMPRFGGGRKS